MSVMTRNGVPLSHDRGERKRIVTAERKALLRKLAAGAAHIGVYGAIMVAAVAAVVGLKAFFIMSRMPFVF